MYLEPILDQRAHVECILKLNTTQKNSMPKHEIGCSLAFFPFSNRKIQQENCWIGKLGFLIQWKNCYPDNIKTDTKNKKRKWLSFRTFFNEKISCNSVNWAQSFFHRFAADICFYSIVNLNISFLMMCK